MAVDFNKFGKSTSGNAQVEQPTGTTSTAVAERPVSTGKIDFNKFGKQNLAQTQQNGSNIDYGAVQSGGNEILKTMIGAPATMVARPVQLGMAASGMTEDEIDATTRKYTGGVVAPVVRGQGEYGLPSASDMTKEAGRAAQTVAFGLTAPGTLLSSGALMGAGTALENQGTDAFTTKEGAAELAFNTAAGMALGKAVDVGAKPLFKGAGYVAGKVAGPAVSKAVSNTASNVAGKVGGYMEKTELPLVSKFSKPASEAITKGAQAFDAGTNKLFSGAKNVAGKAITTWQPGLSKENQTKHWVEKESKDMLTPATDSSSAGKRFSDAKDIYENAKARDIDIADTAIKRKVFTDDLIESGHYNSADAAKVEREEAAKESYTRMRQALAEADQETQRVTIREVRQKMLSDLNKEKLIPEVRAKRKAEINRLYSDTGAAAKEHPNGYSLTELHDAKILQSQRAKYNPNTSDIANTEVAKQAEHQASVFRALLEDRAPKRLNIKNFNKEIQARFTLANYLDALHGKRVEEGIVKKFLRQTSRVGGFIAGSSVGGGYLAGLGGSHLSAGAIDLFDSMSNPFKRKALQEMKISEPAVFKEFEKYIRASKDAKEVRLLLGDGNPTVRPKAKADTATKNKVSAILQKQQNEKGAIPLNQYYKPLTAGEKMANDFKQNMRIAGNTKSLPAPASRIITPNTQGTPNPVGTPYKAGGNKKVEDMGQRAGEANSRAQQKWRMSGTKETFEKWMSDKTPEGNPKRLFGGEAKKKEVTEPAKEKVSEPVKSKEPKAKKAPAQKFATQKSLKEMYNTISKKNDADVIAEELRKVGVSEENIAKKKNLLVTEKNPKTIKDIVDSVIPKKPVNTTKKRASKIDSKDVVGEKTKYVSSERDNIIQQYHYYFDDNPPETVHYEKVNPGKGAEIVHYRTPSNIPKNLPEEYRTRVMFNQVKPYWEAQVRPSKPGKTQKLYDMLQEDVDKDLKEAMARKAKEKKEKKLKDYYEF